MSNFSSFGLILFIRFHINNDYKAIKKNMKEKQKKRIVISDVRFSFIPSPIGSEKPLIES